MLPVRGADGLRDNLRENQDKKCHKCGNDSKPSISEEDRCLAADSGGTYGVGDSVQGKDRRKRFLGVGLVSQELIGELVPLFFPHRDERQRSRHECRLKD